MKKEIIYEIPGLYRDDFRITGYTFGEGEPALCIVGNTRGNEYQQLFTCSQIVRRLKSLEAKGRLVPGKKILVIPSVNPYSVNIKKRFWPIDNTDINRMFPGYDQGETTQRIAAAVFDVISKYKNGIQFTSFYMPGVFVPHISLMHSGFENVEGAKQFVLPYVFLHTVRSYDSTTLNYNWQIWETNAYSLYTHCTDRIDQESADQAVHAIINFMQAEGIVDTEAFVGYQSKVVDDKDMISVRTSHSGLFSGKVKPMQEVQKGDLLAQIIDPYEGDVVESLRSPAHAIIFFAHDEPDTYNHTAVYKLIPISE